jgi:hypothetical protein
MYEHSPVHGDFRSRPAYLPLQAVFPGSQKGSFDADLRARNLPVLTTGYSETQSVRMMAKPRAIQETASYPKTHPALKNYRRNGFAA